MDKIFKEFKPDIVYHAAAYKHVPSETKFTIRRPLITILVLVTVDLAIKNGISQFIFISTDKAVRPTNIMGSSKRLAEIYLQKKIKKIMELKFPPSGLKCSESSGSVVPIFKAN